jgi:hypothetical protein
VASTGGPDITDQPDSVTVCVNDDPTFAVVAGSTDPPSLAYQWQKNGVDIAGANSATYQKAQGGDEVQVTTYKKRGHEYALLTVRPFEYNPGKSMVRYPQEVQLQVSTAVDLPKAAGPRLGEVSVVEITISNRSELDALNRDGYDISNVRGNLVTIYASGSELASLQAAGYKPIEIERQTPGVPKEAAGGIKALGTYHTYATLTSDLQAWAAAHSDIARLVSL